MIPTIRKDSKPSRKTTMNACSMMPYSLVENDYHFQHFCSHKKAQKAQKSPFVLFVPFLWLYNGLSGMAIARHIWATGLLSFPRPSFGFLKCRPTMSMNGSIVTTTPGSKAYKSFTVTNRGSMYHL